MTINRIYNEDCLDTMARMPDGFIDLTVTSPPYDNLRNYKGYSFNFEAVACELLRVTKRGGVVVWVVGDAVVNGSETGTSFKQALYFKEIGFNIHDTMIYEKNSASYPASGKSKRYTQLFEYMFILSKGVPSKINLLKDKKNRWGGYSSFGNSSTRHKDGTINEGNKIHVSMYGYRGNIWKYNNGNGYTTSDEVAYGHPAMFPEQLAGDHINTWSNKDDIVYDPFSGSGTTAKMAHILNRNWIGSEISKEYVKISEQRLMPYLQQLKII